MDFIFAICALCYVSTLILVAHSLKNGADFTSDLLTKRIKGDKIVIVKNN